MNFNELLGGVGKELMNAAGEALAGAAKEYLGNAINEIFVKKEADTKRTLANTQHMKVVSSPAVLGYFVEESIMVVKEIIRTGGERSIATRSGGIRAKEFAKTGAKCVS